MRVITVPAAVEIPGRAEPVKFADFLVAAVDGDKRFGSGVKNIRLGQKIVDKVLAADGQLILEDAEYDALKAAVESDEWVPGYARRVLSFFDAVLAAQEQKEKA